MKYPSELCQLVIKNMAVVEEAPNVTEYVEKKLFTAINAHIEEKISSQNGWIGVYDLCTDKKEQETNFAPVTWPKTTDGDFLAYFSLGCAEAGADSYWLSNAIGLGGTALEFDFVLSREFTGLDAKEHKKLLHSFYRETPALVEAGFLITKNATIYRQFYFEAESLATNFPYFEEALSPLNMALEDLLKVYGEFARLILKVSGLQEEQCKN